MQKESCDPSAFQDFSDECLRKLHVFYRATKAYLGTLKTLRKNKKNKTKKNKHQTNPNDTKGAPNSDLADDRCQSSHHFVLGAPAESFCRCVCRVVSSTFISLRRSPGLNTSTPCANDSTNGASWDLQVVSMSSRNPGVIQ